jgi:hypothetical protein
MLKQVIHEGHRYVVTRIRAQQTIRQGRLDIHPLPVTSREKKKIQDGRQKNLR